MCRGARTNLCCSPVDVFMVSVIRMHKFSVTASWREVKRHGVQISPWASFQHVCHGLQWSTHY